MTDTRNSGQDRISTSRWRENASDTAVSPARHDPPQRGGFADVNTFPEELLVEVFSLIVCHRWREVIRSNSKFWSRILVFKSRDWLTHSLTRCRGAPADIIFLSSAFPYHNLPAILADHVSYIRSLQFHRVEPAWETSISTLLTQHTMPALEHLTILNPDPDSTVGVGLSISPGQLPRLQTLELSRFRVPEEVTLLRSLRSLSIHHGALPMLFRDFLAILHQSTVLHELYLSDSFDKYGGSLLLRSPLEGPPLELPQLRKFNLHSGSRSVILHVLHNLRIPNATNIEVTGEYLGAAFVKNGPVFKPCLFAGTRPPAATFPTLQHTTDLRLNVGSDECSLEARNATHRVGLHLFNLQSNHYVGAVIQDVIDLFSAAPISKVTFSWYQDGYHAQDDLWKTFFCAFPHLETLNASGFGTREIWLGLYDASAVSTSHAGDSDVCCPRLTSLSVGAASIWNAQSLDETLQQIMSALRCRAERGSKLYELELELDVERDEEDASMRQVALPRLKEFADVVRYKRCAY
ncbi:hypothetical protein C8T65DRAFT_662604 [Cerioporus squamosus]|nr:hypothetical protein C8T65DRAFT_662604 [Cerioporus squamosus]